MSEINTTTVNNMTTTEVTPNEVMEPEINSEIIPDAVPEATSDINIGACATSGIFGAVIGFGIAKLMDTNEEKEEARKQKKAEREKKKEEKKKEKEEKRFENYQKLGKFLGVKVERLPVEEPKDKDNPDNKDTDKK